MSFPPRSSSVRTVALLHPVFALTGVLHAVGGALLPSLALRFHLSDSASGLLFLLYFAGTSLGALLCRGSYARLITIGFAAMVCTCLAVAACPRSLLAPAFLLLGISVGVPMSAVTLFVGRAYPARCAPLLTFLNFSWSIGALAAPLIAARVLMHHNYQAAYILFASASAAAALASAFVLRDPPEPLRAPSDTRSNTALYLIAVFAFAAFLQVGIENTVAAWLPTYALRTAAAGIVLAAASTSFYWAGFLCSRGFSSLLLLRAEPVRVFRIAVAVAFVSALLLVFAPSVIRSQPRHVPPRRIPGPDLSPRPRRLLCSQPSHCRLSLDPFHCRIRRLGSPLDRRLHVYPHWQPPHRNDDHTRRFASHGLPSPNPPRPERESRTTLALISSAKGKGSHQGSPSVTN